MAKKKKQQRDDGVALAPGNAAAEAADEGGGGCGENEEKNEGGDCRKPEKNHGGSITVVLKVDMHCEGCSKKVVKSVRGVQGVEAVMADAGIGKLTVVGKLDPWKLRDHVEAKSHKKVDLISPTNFPKNADTARKPSAAKQTDEKKQHQEKLVVTTVTLKIRLHCEGCIRRIRKTILKIKGVESVVFDTQTDQVIVKGTMDSKALPEKLKTKMKRDVVVVQPKKEGGGGEKKEKVGAGEEEKKKKKDGAGEGEKKKKDGGEEKKKGSKGGGGGGGEKKEEELVKAAAVGAAPAGYAMEYYGGYGYRFEMVHAPQLFSDENPNSCSVM
ncbi:heavy metal-associated isoprenylated plant protein 3-like [Curcuma longa]|uniref:heavy metal-associated isoprenylated plant protein 3-like n=1 Tax=Curcuma longa TaxID=136217 RepID=UPI003D9ECC48